MVQSNYDKYDFTFQKNYIQEEDPERLQPLRLKEAYSEAPKSSISLSKQNSPEQQTPQDRENMVIKEGWIEKRSRHLKHWRKRWLVLTPKFIMTFKDQSDFQNKKSSATERIYLRNCSDVQTAEVELKMPHSFKIITQDRDFFFKTKDNKEFNMWMDSISETLRQPLIALKKSF